MKRPYPSALVFDFDGLICDTELPEFLAWQEVFESFGAKLSLETWSACIGSQDSGFDIYRELATAVGRDFDRSAVRSLKQARFESLLANPLPLPGVRDWIAAARRAGIAIGIASSSGREWVEGILRRLDLVGEFATICCREDVPKTKPEPWLYLLAAERLGVPPAQVIALEDSPNGVLSAKQAGMFCIAVPNTLTRLLPIVGADLTIDSLSDLSLERAIQHWNGREVH